MPFKLKFRFRSGKKKKSSTSVQTPGSLMYFPNFTFFSLIPCDKPKLVICIWTCSTLYHVDTPVFISLALINHFRFISKAPNTIIVIIVGLSVWLLSILISTGLRIPFLTVCLPAAAVPVIVTPNHFIITTPSTVVLNCIWCKYRMQQRVHLRCCQPHSSFTVVGLPLCLLLPFCCDHDSYTAFFSGSTLLFLSFHSSSSTP